MIITIWKSLGLFTEPKKTIKRLLKYSSQDLLKNGILLSFVGMFAQSISAVFQQGTLSPMILLSLLPYYMSSFIFLSILTAIHSLNHDTVDIRKVLGIYLIIDLVMLVVFPITLMSIGFPVISGLLQFLIFLVGAYVFCLKFIALSQVFQMTITKTILLSIAPFLFVLLSLIISALDAAQYLF
ncbi:MAG: hypothetical protein ACRCS8_01535 [Brevinema sp.]